MSRRALTALAVLLPVVAAAEWFTPVARPAVSNDLSVTDAGIFAFPSSTGAFSWLVLPDGGSSQVASVAGFSDSATSFGASCLMASQVVGATPHIAFSSAACGTDFNVGSFPPTVTVGHRVRRMPSGLMAATFKLIDGNEHLYTGLTAPLVDLVPLPLASPVEPVMAAQRYGGIDYIVFNVAAGVRLSVDGGAHAVLSPLQTTSLTMFEHNGSPALLLQTDGGVLVMLPDFAGQPGTTVAIPGPPGEVLHSVSFSLAGGDDAGVGYGFLSTMDGGLYSPLPDPSRPAAVWVKRQAPEPVVGALECVDARFCAAHGETNMLAFWNNAAPQLTAPTGLMLREGQAVSATATASDGDGDPVFVQWSGPQVVAVDVSDAGNGTEVQLSTTLVPACTGTTLADVLVTASDGLAAHTQRQPLSVPVLRLRGPDQPAIVPANPVANAGGAPLTLTAVNDGGCAPTGHVWTQGDGGAVAGTQDFVFTPPATWCSADAGLVDVSVVAVDALDASVPGTTQVQVLPWGTPEVPVFTSPATQNAGSSATYGNEATTVHACQSTNGFPGTELIWTVQDAGLTSLSFSTGDAGLTVTSTDVCTSATVTASAVQHVVNGPAGVVSAPASLTINVVPNPEPLTAATTFSMDFQYDAMLQQASGAFLVGANCIDTRGLFADVDIVRPDGGGRLVGQRYPIPAADAGWGPLTVVGGCSGGDLEAVATLLWPDGGPVGPTDRAPFTTSFRQVAIDAITPTTLPVRCGEGARGTVSAVIPASGCAAAAWRWQQLDGPQAILVSDGGAGLSLSTTALDYSVVGQPLTIELSGDAGAGNGAARSQVIELVPEPFVGVHTELSSLRPRVEEPLDVSVTLTNQTDCAVDGLTVRVELTDLSGLPGTAALNGRASSAVLEGNTVLVNGLSLAPRAVSHLTLRARPVQLGTPGVAAQAFLSGYAVAVPETPSPVASCGCSGAAGGLSLLPLGWALWAALRRRRRGSTPGANSL